MAYITPRSVRSADPDLPGLRLLLVRHGAVHNPQQLFYGRLPRFPLSAQGQAQAQATARFLAAFPVTALYTSPRLRARQTARIIQAYHPQRPLRVSSLLDEVRTGWQGAPASAIPEPLNLYDPPYHPDDETIAAVFARLDRFVRRVRRRHPGGTVVAVSHADPIAILTAGYAGRPLILASLRGPFYPPLASVTCLEFALDASRPVITVFDPAGTAERRP